MGDRNRTWLRRHPIVVLLAVNVVLFGFLLLAAEIFLRLWVPYNPGYYVAVRGTSKEVEYPYGVIKINRDGFPDDEFDLSRSPRVGYFGDSVTYGVGAGYGYRFTDYLRVAYPNYSHMNFGGIGLSVSRETIEQSLTLAERYDLDCAVYFMNLNDIVPDEAVAPVSAPASAREESEVPWTRLALVWVERHADWLRGKSYLYTSLRTAAKNALEARGVGFHGYRAYEFHPKADLAVLMETARRVELFHDELARHGVELIVVLLPYEMQISDEAARTYAQRGIHWEEGFLEGSAQAVLKAELESHMRVIDLLPAFIDPVDPASSRAENGVGEYFVFDRGDKLDWNHPNRAGHRRIADHLAGVELLGPVPGPETSTARRAELPGR